MREQGQEFRSAEEVQAAAQTEFEVDLRDHGAVMRKATELAHAANRLGRRPEAQQAHDRSQRLTDLFEAYQKLTAGKQEQVRQAA